MELHYIFDPLCGWCYGAARLVHGLAARLPPEISLRLWPGALFPAPVVVQAGMRAHIVEADQRIHALTGAEFGPAYVARISDPGRQVTLWSVPVIAAIAAAPPARALEMLAALQHAHYVEGRDLSDMATLARIAAHIGLDAGDFSATLQSPAHAQATAAWIRDAQALMARAGVGGFPAFLLEREGRLMALDHNAAYQDVEILLRQIALLARAR